MAWWHSGQSVGLVTQKVAGSNLDSSAFRTSCSHTCASITKQYNLVPAKTPWCPGWGGNRRSGVALAMCHRLQWFIQSQPKGDEVGVCHTFYFVASVWKPQSCSNRFCTFTFGTRRPQMAWGVFCLICVRLHFDLLVNVYFLLCYA